MEIISYNNVEKKAAAARSKMIHGDRVKIISYNEIKSMFIKSRSVRLYDKLRFVEEMEKHCEKIVTLISCYKRENRKGYVWNVEENPWVWHEDWLCNFTEKFLSDKDFEI